MALPAESKFKRSARDTILEQVDFIKQRAEKFAQVPSRQEENIEEEINLIFDAIDNIKPLLRSLTSSELQIKAKEFVESIESLTAGATSDLMETSKNMKLVSDICDDFNDLLGKG